MRLGIGVASVYTRTPALLAMSAATVQESSRGRFVLGLGASSERLVESWMGQERRLPLTRVRETVAAIRQALSGEPTDFQGTTLSTRRFRLATGPSHVPIMLGTLGPRMFRLAGEIADGAITIFATAEALPELLGDLRESAVANKRSPADIEVVVRVTVGLNEDTPELRMSLRQWVASYLSAPEYDRLVRRQGFVEEADAVSDAWGRRDAVRAAACVSDALLESLVALGDIDHVTDRLRHYEAAGATTIVISPVTSVTGPADRARRLRQSLLELATEFGA
jgi:probable F420-dependent oxidoreductase